jgi:hypothetical protein
VKVWRNRSRMGRTPAVCAAMFIAFATVEISAASCVTELDKIVRTDQGRVRGSRGEIIADAQVTVTSSSEDEIFRTKSGRDGLFRLAISPGKYRVEVEAKGYLRFIYIVDLRSAVAAEPLDVALQGSSDCHDIRVTPEEGNEVSCSSELLLPNLILRTPTTINGKVKDETGAPFKNSEIVLRRISAIPLQPSYLFAKTDADGTFGFDEAEQGEYRLLASPSRAFAQPAKLDCYERRDCNLEIILKANGTDRPYASCPVR